MSNAEIQVTNSGPYVVTGPVILKDADGNVYDTGDRNAVLCRCGHSGNKPFCDGTHKKIGFDATERAS
jgi:CDGSH-type Zn-finger protein